MANLSKPDASQLLNNLQQFAAFPHIKTWWLAYSGGLDSRVLLHLMSQLNLPLRAVYVDHGLQSASAVWAQHCAQTCSALSVPFQVLKINAQAQPGESPEAAARQARYLALAGLIQSHEVLLTAQHADDQAETLLLQLLRGAGSAGLSAMPWLQEFHCGWQMRPLLDFSRQSLLHVAQENKLQWVDDPSNQDQKFDRNYLRHSIMPLLMERWPGALQTLGRAAKQQAENQQLLQQLATSDLSMRDIKAELPIANLKMLDEARQRNALRYWFDQQSVRMPSRAVLQQIELQLLQGRDDSDACVCWDAVELHRYQDKLYVHAKSAHAETQVLDWDGQQALLIPTIGCKLEMMPANKNALDKAILKKKLQIRFRRGGESIKPAGDQHTRTLKNLLQQWKIPPWLRNRIPLLYGDDQMLAVCGYCVSEDYLAANSDGLLPVITTVES